MDTKPPQKRNKIIIKTAFFISIKTNEIKNLERLAMKIAMLGRKLNIKRITKSLDKFEMNELEAKVNEEIKILEKRKNKAKENIKSMEKLKYKSKSTLTDIETLKTIKFLLAQGTSNIFIRSIKKKSKIKESLLL